jgi:hypothetical protein
MHLHAIPPHKVQKSPPLNVQSYSKTVIRTKEGYAWNLQTGPTDGFHQCGNTRLC